MLSASIVGALVSLIGGDSPFESNLNLLESDCTSSGRGVSCNGVTETEPTIRMV